MTLKRLILILLTVFAIALTALSLYNSWSQPQFQSRLELYQTNLLLNASEWQGQDLSTDNVQSARKVLFGDEPLQSALQRYQEFEETVETNLEKNQALLSQIQAQEPSNSTLATQQQLERGIRQSEVTLEEVKLRIGILQAEVNNLEAAVENWQALTTLTDSNLTEVAQVLLGLWSNPPQLLPDAEATIQNHLNGWFRYQSLERLYQLQQRPDALSQLQANQQEIAEASVVKLTIAGAIQGLGGLIGVLLLIFLVAQRLLKGKEAILAANEGVVWETPWDFEIILQVLVFGFFFVGQVILGRFFIPLTFGILRLNPAEAGVRIQAFSILLSYIFLMTGGLGVLYLSVKSYRPLPQGWFNFRVNWSWIGWGVGGFLVALPLVVLVSLINQQLWQGQGGSNPILPIALSGQDPVAIAIFFLTASVAAPVFEEIIFRGFFLPSLTRYIPVWGSILLSAFVFAVAHLSLSEILPLMTLGIILGFVYSRSRNLLAPILLHSLWNGSTLLSLFLLGSSAS